MVPELQMQAQGNSQGIPAFNGLSSAYPNQSTAPPVQSYPGHPLQQQQHPMSPQQSHALSNSHHAHLQGSNHATGSQQQQAYAMRLAKERQMQQQQQRLMQQHQQQLQPQPQPPPQQQQQFPASGALMPHVQPQSQLPISSSLQNSSQIQSQVSTQPVSLPPLTPSSPMTPMSLQHQQKHSLAPHSLGRSPQPGAGGLANQVGKQRQRQPLQQQQQFQQSGRHHPQQRQQTQSQQQAKLLKGVGRGSVLVHQNLSVDPAHLNGLTMAPGNQAAEKGEQMMHLIQGQGLYSGSGMSPVQPSKPLVSSQSSNHSQPQQKLFPGATPPTKQLQQMASHSDNSTQGQGSAVPSGHTPSAVHHSVMPAGLGPNHQHLQPQSQPHQKQVNQNQPRMLQQNRQVNSDHSKSQAEPAQADQQPVNSASQIGTSTTMAMPQAVIDSANNTAPVVSQWKSSESVYDPVMPNVATQVGSIGSSPLTNPAAGDPSVSQGLGQRQLSGGLPPHGNNAGGQWPQQPQMQQSSTPPPSQQHYQPQEQSQQDQHISPQQLPLQQQSQQKNPHLQAVQGSLYHRPSNSKLE